MRRERPSLILGDRSPRTASTPSVSRTSSSYTTWKRTMVPVSRTLLSSAFRVSSMSLMRFCSLDSYSGLSSSVILSSSDLVSSAANAFPMASSSFLTTVSGSFSSGTTSNEAVNSAMESLHLPMFDSSTAKIFFEELRSSTFDVSLCISPFRDSMLSFRLSASGPSASSPPIAESFSSQEASSSFSSLRRAGADSYSAMVEYTDSFLEMVKDRISL